MNWLGIVRLSWLFIPWLMSNRLGVVRLRWLFKPRLSIPHRFGSVLVGPSPWPRLARSGIRLVMARHMHPRKTMMVCHGLGSNGAAKTSQVGEEVFKAIGLVMSWYTARWCSLVAGRRVGGSGLTSHGSSSLIHFDLAVIVFLHNILNPWPTSIRILFLRHNRGRAGPEEE